jgi:hypothetical protein
MGCHVSCYDQAELRQAIVVGSAALLNCFAHHATVLELWLTTRLCSSVDARECTPICVCYVASKARNATALSPSVKGQPRRARGTACHAWKLIQDLGELHFKLRQAEDEVRAAGTGPHAGPDAADENSAGAPKLIRAMDAARDFDRQQQGRAHFECGNVMLQAIRSTSATRDELERIAFETFALRAAPLELNESHLRRIFTGSSLSTGRGNYVYIDALVEMIGRYVVNDRQKGEEYRACSQRQKLNSRRHAPRSHVTAASRAIVEIERRYRGVHGSDAASARLRLVVFRLTIIFRSRFRSGQHFQTKGPPYIFSPDRTVIRTLTWTLRPLARSGHLWVYAERYNRFRHKRRDDLLRRTAARRRLKAHFMLAQCGFVHVDVKSNRRESLHDRQRDSVGVIHNHRRHTADLQCWWPAIDGWIHATMKTDSANEANSQEQDGTSTVRYRVRHHR